MTQNLFDWLLLDSIAGAPGWAWLLFLAIVLGLLALDLGVLHHGDRAMSMPDSLRASLVYIVAALLFGGWIWHEFGSDAGLRFLTGYVIEKSLSLDNIFVISLIFGYLVIPAALQHRVLFWGILGVLLMRALLIGAGTALVHEFAWLLPMFGLLLIVAAIRMLGNDEATPSHSQAHLLAALRQRLPVTETLHGRALLARLPDPSRPGRHKLYVTPLLLALVLIECADALFALESVPAILAITQEPYLVYTSNIFAVLGLRALYFALAAMVTRLAYLKHTLALILIFIGGKILFQHFGGHVPPLVSLCVTLSLLVGGTLLSWRAERRSGGKLAGMEG
ncbi:MAG TPA: TerC/Alx family metal homeostasis membrane protein [Novosphingobium sp.]